MCTRINSFCVNQTTSIRPIDGPCPFSKVFVIKINERETDRLLILDRDLSISISGQR